MQKIFFPLLLLLLSLSARANVVGSDHQNFNPTTNGIDFITVQSGQTLDPGILNFGFFLNYAANTLSFLEKSNTTLMQNKSHLNDKLLSADLNFGLGLTENWDVGFSLPVLLSQELQNDYNIAYFDKTGNTEQRINTKYRFFQSGLHSWAAILSMNRNNIDNNPYVGADPGLVTNFELATSWKHQDWWYGVNVGHRWRSKGRSLASTFSIDPIPNQYIASLAASKYIPSWDLKWIIETYGSSPSESTGSNLSNREYANWELLSGLKWDRNENLALHAGVGTELMQGFGTPDYRLYAGLNYVVGPLWKKSVAQASEPVAVAPPRQEVRSFVLTNLKFKFDSDILEEVSVPQVDDVIAIIKKIGDFEKITVEGHTDSVGNDDYNMRLSDKRAHAIKNKLLPGLSVKPEKIQAHGFGETQPVADNSNYQGRAQNRRVVVTVFTKKTVQTLSH